MGAGGSKGDRIAGDSIFPLDEATDKKLDRLSYLMARMLSTPDIYDISNLTKPGTCGEYAVFLKQKIERQILKQTSYADRMYDHLLPFVVDISGEPAVEVVYKNPRKAGIDMESRRRICSSLANTVLRAITTVMACLASIQVKSKSREDQVERVPKMVGGSGSYVQSGGDIHDVYQWFLTNGYVQGMTQVAVGRQEMSFAVPQAPTHTRFKYKLTLLRSNANISTGLFSIDPKGLTSQPPPGYIQVQFLPPVPLPVPGQTKTVLPMRIYDQAGTTWGAGVFYGNSFKPFSPARQIFITELVEQLFLRIMGYAVPVPVETREQIAKSNDVFKMLQRDGNPELVYQVLNQFFQEKVQGYQRGYQMPGMVYGQPPLYGQPPPYGPPPYGAQPPYGPPQPAYGGPAYGGPAYGQQPVYPAQQQPMYPSQRYGYGVPAVRGPAGDYSYDIPQNASIAIIKALKDFREVMAIQSSPAYSRAHTLAGYQDDNRVFKSNICEDPYWKAATLTKIHPWATLQFLSFINFSKIVDNRSNALLDNEWTQFISDLKQIYSGPDYPNLNAPTNFLGDMKFTGMNNIQICKGARGEVSIQNTKRVQDGLYEIQGIYARHVPKVWGILNKLIMPIKDPDTGTEVVRLHVDVMKGVGRETSQAYVDRVAAEARALIAKFYIDIEKSYKNTIQALA